MARTRATAVSAIVLALGLTGVGVTPFIVQSASATAAAYEPPVEPCEAGECNTTPETTVTVTTTLPTPTEEEEPETTVTRTVTASPPKKSKTPTPSQSKTTKAPPSTPQETPTQDIAPLPSQSIEVPSTSAPPTSPEPSFEMPAVAPSDTPTAPPPSQSPVSSSEELPVELRAAQPEFDQRDLTQKLSIPALVLVLLALFAVLIFEGRLRRMAHAAAVRKAGPPTAHPEGPPVGGGYPAGPGYAAAGFPTPGYPGGTAYAPIISFVPVQTYPSGQVQYGAVYQEPPQPYPPHGPAQEAPEPPVVLHPDEFDSFNHEPPASKEYRDPFEPAVQPAQVPSDIPPGGSSPFEGKPDQPFGPASSAESGDSEPWQNRPDSGSAPLFTPSQPYDPPPYLAADAEATAVQPPLPPQPEPEPQPEPPASPEPTKELPDAKRKLFRRSK
ncbi:hypothetical protein ABZ897_40640 [Nonomuraea sp. NPDC046802]|uniref:hypothetical protein n=1 Tax=Nonomuraea sp. NPDC046802 TaxID=3154919 RepID=UPI0033FFBDA0